VEATREFEPRATWTGGAETATRGRAPESLGRLGGIGEAANTRGIPQKEEVKKDMSKIKNWAVRKAAEYQVAREDGQGLAEYGLILALIAVVCVIALTTLGTAISGLLNQLAGSI
jgi:pilus assembly protein Flp/PilA